ncbi:hypothetical protein J6590_029295 [Homalodisca vitripennis]|nr:hypothetical protein J6590_029295 [Homalodisca vitripennis]
MFPPWHGRSDVQSMSSSLLHVMVPPPLTTYSFIVRARGLSGAVWRLGELDLKLLIL